jgi:hypothetical protein
MPFEDDPHGDDAQAVGPCAFGLLVGTLALMTAHATPEPAAREDTTTLRRLMARKIVSNLFFLQQHPDAPPPLRQVATRLHARWLPLAQIEAVAQALTMADPAVGSSLH